MAENCMRDVEDDDDYQDLVDCGHHSFGKELPYRRRLATVRTRTMPDTSSRLATIANSAPMMTHLTNESALRGYSATLAAISATP